MYKDKNIQKLVDELDIVQVIGEYVVLKKTGANYKGLSPFKEENTPSFVVSPTKNMYKDFSSGDGGDVISFYRKINNLSFSEAVNELAKKYNIAIKALNTNSEKFNENIKYYEIMKEAQSYFSKNIYESPEAIEYMVNRGFEKEELKKFEIGFSLNKWDGLLTELTNKGYELEDLMELGLVSRNENGNTFDYFRNRIMFPIYNESMRIVGFGGRIIGDDTNMPKYLNSPESKIFKKGRELFGLTNRGENIRKRNVAILMEGYLDVLSAHKYGFEYSVASLGTAFTPEQAELIKKYTQNIIIAYDNDSAGKVATIKAAQILKKHGLNIRCLVINDVVKDPDEYLRQYGRKAFIELLKTSTEEIFDYLYKEYSKDLDLKNIIGKEKFLNRFKEFMSNTKSPLEKSFYIQKLSVELEVDKEILTNSFFVDQNRFKKENRNFKNEYDPKFMKKVSFKRTKEEKYSLLKEQTIKYLLKYNSIKDKKIQEHCNNLINKKMDDSYYDEIFEKLKKVDFIANIEKIEELDLNEKMKKDVCSWVLNNDQDVTNERENEEEIQYRDLFVGWFKKLIEETKEKVDKKNIILSIKLKSIESDLKVMNRIDEIEKLYFDFISEESKNV